MDDPELTPKAIPGLIRCPNCDTSMKEEAHCPACPHDDASDWCQCDSCVDGRAPDEDEDPCGYSAFEHKEDNDA